jgi:polyhydroxyalkanoate synthesis regulator phasin
MEKIRRAQERAQNQAPETAKTAQQRNGTGQQNSRAKLSNEVDELERALFGGTVL